MCRRKWLQGRKDGTVWSHPARSSYDLTVSSLVDFQVKSTGTLPDPDARAPDLKLGFPACCV